jgi:hypothetical protein
MADGRSNGLGGRHCSTGIITTAQKDTRVRDPNGGVYSCDTRRSEEENIAIVAEAEELHKTELYLPGVHLTGSAAKDGTGGQSQLSCMASVISNEDITYELAQQQRKLAKQQKQLVEQQLVTNRVIEAISSGKDRTQTADALGFTARQLAYHFTECIR